MADFRPIASHGLWLSALLFIAFLQTMLLNPDTVQLSYKLSTVLLLGMFLQSLETFFVLSRDATLIIIQLIARLIPGLVTSAIIRLMLHQEIILSVVAGMSVTGIYRLSYVWLMKSLSFSFTLGEATIVTQGIITFLFNCCLSLPFVTHVSSSKEDINLVLQAGLLAVLIIVLVTKLVPLFRKWFMFYLLFLVVGVGVCFVPINDKLAITILYNFIFNDIQRTIIVGIYVVLLLLAGFVVTWQLNKNQKGTTSTRKIFHILIVMAIVPGLIFQCQFLYVASVVILAVFIILELARVIELYPVAEGLESAVKAFIDEKDAGKVALTPVYLLVGCSLPLWIHNTPCDQSGSSSLDLLPFLAGVLSIGIGDTFASFVGSKIGKHKWPQSKKSVEGTIASIIAQSAFIYALNILGYLPLSARLTAICGVAVITNSLVEALTDQVDNLVLPILTYIILTL